MPPRSVLKLGFLVSLAACSEQSLAPLGGSAADDMPVFASQPVGPVTINTVIDFSEFPFTGTFTVTDGSLLLGCSAGTFVDIPAGEFSRGAIRKTFTCTTGANAGSSFTIQFRPGPVPGPGDANGHWQVVSGTGGFENLRGSGDFSVTFSPTEPTGFETLTGAIHFDP